MTTIKKAIVTTLIALVSMHAVAENAKELLVSGPVDAVSADSVAVLGRSIATNDAYRVVVGQRVNVYGVLKEDGSIADAELESISAYVPGADPVYVRGVITQADASTGTAQVGGLSIDYTSLLSSTEFTAPQVGETVEISGTQPAGGGVVLATETGVSVALSSGTGVGRALSSGTGVGRALSSGTGVGRALSSGTGVGRALSSGNGAAGA